MDDKNKERAEKLDKIRVNLIETACTLLNYEFPEEDQKIQNSHLASVLCDLMCGFIVHTVPEEKKARALQNIAVTLDLYYAHHKKSNEKENKDDK